MLFRRKSKTTRKRPHAWLYYAVFTGRFSLSAVLFLIASFVLQPIDQAYGSGVPEEPVEEIIAVAEDVLEQPVAVPETPDIEVPLDENILPEETPAPSPSEAELEEQSTPESDEETATATDEDPDDTAPEENSNPDGNGDSEDLIEEVEEVLDEPQATSSEGSIVEVQYLITDDNYFQFSKDSCVAVGSGAYHCSTNAVSEIDTNSVVYAEQGEGGDMEIFLKTTRGSVKQITDNNNDDTAPHYDAESMRVVWQRLVDGRYQIVLYDIMEGEETQLTYSRTNNMEPKVSDAGIVWQAWDNNDWEIMHFDGTYTDQLTSNEAQDVAPVIQDGYVLWSVLGGNDQQARVYSLETKETVSIVGHEGGSIVNPRFVLVYDAKFDNGDVVTHGFDPATGLSSPIAATSAPEPINIPENDPTGEIRALIQGKSQKDEKDFTDIENDDVNASSTQNEPGTLNLKPPGDSAISSTVIISASPTGTPFELTDYDLVLVSPDPQRSDASAQD